MYRLMGPLVMGWSGAMRTVADYIAPEVEARLRTSQTGIDLNTNQVSSQ